MMKTAVYLFSTVAVLTATVSCVKNGFPDSEDNRIAFYVKTTPVQSPSVKSIIEDTGTLVDGRLPIYVSDGLTNPAFSNTEVAYTKNGVWKSNVDWTDKEYSFYAYIASPIAQPTSTNGGISNILNNGSILYINQPKTYTKSEDVWADYLMSYRVKVNGADKPLVKLDFERLTSCVELYMGMGVNMSEVTVKKIEFRNVNTRAKYELKYHAVPGDNADNSGMKNIWSVMIDDSEVATYTYQPQTNIEGLLKMYDAENRFVEDNLKMRFLTVQQDVMNIELYIEYQALENGKQTDYTAVFELADYPQEIWYRGHKIRYFVGIDSSVDLEGTIEEWKTVEFIETTLLPDQI